jgi:hypothetical protein
MQITYPKATDTSHKVAVPRALNPSGRTCFQTGFPAESVVQLSV